MYQMWRICTKGGSLFEKLILVCQSWRVCTRCGAYVPSLAQQRGLKKGAKNQLFSGPIKLLGLVEI
jgi:hypothetical protein